MAKLVGFLIIVSSIYFAVGVNVWGDFDFMILDAEPSSDVSMKSFQLEVLFDSPGNVRMGFGLELSSASVSNTFLEEPFEQSLGIYAVGVYTSDFVSSLNMMIISRGGIVLPDYKLSRMAYFTEIEVALTYDFFKNWYASLGTSIKSYSFDQSYISFIPIKIGIGGDL